MSVDFWDIEKTLFSEGYRHICGVDEAGRGPLAGPVFAAAVILPLGTNIPHLNDSKKLSESTRAKLYNEIINISIAYAVSYADHLEIDNMNVLNATYLAMNRAIKLLKITPDIAIVDGNRDKGIETFSKTIIGGDGKSASIAAASILAKVSRDNYMLQIAEKYPRYAFEKHKGYGTKLHYERLREFGHCEVHRVTFLKKFFDAQQKIAHTGGMK